MFGDLQITMQNVCLNFYDGQKLKLSSILIRLGGSTRDPQAM